MKPARLSSCPQNSATFCHRLHNRIHKNMSVFVSASTKICQYLSSCQQKYVSVIVSTNICQSSSECQQKYVSVILFTKICQYLSSCQQKYVSAIMSTEIFSICHRANKNMSVSSCPQKSVRFVIVPRKTCQCHRIHKNLSMFAVVSTETCHLTVTVTHFNHTISLFLALNFHSVSRYPSRFSDHIFLCVSFFSLLTYPFLLILNDYLSAIIFAE